MDHRLKGIAAAVLLAGAVAAVPVVAAPQQQKQQNDLPADTQADNGVCDAYGAGYQRVPGTDTCIKVGGHVQATVDAHGDGH